MVIFLFVYVPDKDTTSREENKIKMFIFYPFFPHNDVNLQYLQASLLVVAV